MNGGSSATSLALGGLEARLAMSTLFREENPHVRITPATSNPAPLGFLSFAFCCALFMAVLTGWVEPEAVDAVYAFAFTFAGLGQVIVGLLEYSRCNVFASNAFLCFGLFWLGTALNGTMQAAGLYSTSVKGSQMVFVLWGLVTFVFWLQTIILNLALFILFGSLTILFFLLAATQTHPGLTQATGGWGIFVAAVSFYIGAAVLFLEMFGKEILPLVAFNWPMMRRRIALGPVGTKRFASEAVPDAAEKA